MPLPQIIQNQLTYRDNNTTIELHIYKRDKSHVIALIDACDLHLISGFRRWNVLDGTCGRQYIRTTVAMTSNKKTILLHHAILGGVPKGKEVAFKNNNSFDCRRSNLIITDHYLVMQQRSLPAFNKLKVRGINKHFNRW